MPDRHAPFSQPWADAFHAAIEADAAYRAAASGWTWPIAFVLEPEPALGTPEPLAVQVALDRGRSLGARALAPDAVDAPFVLRGDRATWRAIVQDGLDPVTAVATGRLTLARGAVTTLMLHTRSARLLVEAARRVATHFPDDR